MIAYIIIYISSKTETTKIETKKILLKNQLKKRKKKSNNILHLCA